MNCSVKMGYKYTLVFSWWYKDWSFHITHCQNVIYILLWCVKRNEYIIYPVWKRLFRCKFSYIQVTSQKLLQLAESIKKWLIVLTQILNAWTNWLSGYVKNKRGDNVMHFSGILNNFNTLGLLDGVHMHMDPAAFMSDCSAHKTITWTRCMPILDKKITKTTRLLFFFFTKTTSGAYTAVQINDAAQG